jgi:hypothetical protein
MMMQTMKKTPKIKRQIANELKDLNSIFPLLDIVSEEDLEGLVFITT